MEFVKKYGLTMGMVFVASYFGTQFKKKFNLEGDTSEVDYELIRKYILNDSPLYGFNKPKLWIHSKYEINARNWESFGSRNTSDLNQSYLTYTVKSIIDHCGDDFHICLIDDDSFKKLIPGYDIEITKMADPLRTQWRELSLLMLIHTYGGLAVPNSFICLKSLIEPYNNLTKKDGVFVFEKNNNSCDMRQKKRKDFVPNIEMIGAKKNTPIIFSLMREIKSHLLTGHMSDEHKFVGKTSNHLMKLTEEENLTTVCGSLIGVKDKKKRPIKIDDLFSNLNQICFSDDLYGIYIPGEEVLKRNLYNWFAALNHSDVLKTNNNIVRAMKKSILTQPERTREIKSISGSL